MLARIASAGKSSRSEGAFFDTAKSLVAQGFGHLLHVRVWAFVHFPQECVAKQQLIEALLAIMLGGYADRLAGLVSTSWATVNRKPGRTIGVSSRMLGKGLFVLPRDLPRRGFPAAANCFWLANSSRCFVALGDVS